VRRSLALVSLAVTVLVVVAFLVPTALLIRDQAADRALTRAERDAQAIAAALAVAPATAGSEVDPELADAVLQAFGNQEDFTIVFPDGEGVGAPYEPTPGIAQAQSGAAFTAQIDGGAEVLVPVLVADAPSEGSSVVVVRTVVSDDALSEGVSTAWLMLGALGVFLVVVAAVAADRLGRNIVRPVAALSEAARSLGQGDLDARVAPGGPREVADVGEAFNFLASRLEALLEAERESVADLSHRLRTPLTALRLQAETLADPDESESLIEDIGRLERAVDRMIEEARRPSRDSAPPVADLAAAVRHRALFWKVLADEQGRAVDVHTTGGALRVGMSGDELGALVDTLIENVFAHTPPGTDYAIWAGPDTDGGVALIVEDHGPGFPDLGVIARGASSGGSTGLGLDIVQRAAVRSGGGLAVGTRPGGGARITVRFGAVGVDEPAAHPVDGRQRWTTSPGASAPATSESRSGTRL
jgi:signal transduction histidine kinase